MDAQEIEPANPNIDQIFDAFLREEETRVGRATYRQYEDAIDLLAICLINYGHLSLLPEELELLESGWDLDAQDVREFTELFGAKHILDSYGEFFGWFLPRKVGPSKARNRAIGAALKRLAFWLAEKGHVEEARAREVAEDAAESVRELAAANDLLALLEGCAKSSEANWEQVEGTFEFFRVEGGDVWVEESGDEYGPIHLPAEVAAKCPVGWTFHGVLGRRGKTWSIAEVWGVMAG